MAANDKSKIEMGKPCTHVNNQSKFVQETESEGREISDEKYRGTPVESDLPRYREDVPAVVSDVGVVGSMTWFLIVRI